MEQSLELITEPFINRLAIALYAFMKQSDMKVEFGKKDGTTYIYNIVDVTGDAQIIAMSFILDLKLMSSFENLTDDDEGIEKFCSAITLDLGCQLFKQKVNKLKRFGNSNSSSGIILPGQ